MPREEVRAGGLEAALRAGKYYDSGAGSLWEKVLGFMTFHTYSPSCATPYHPLMTCPSIPHTSSGPIVVGMWV